MDKDFYEKIIKFSSLAYSHNKIVLDECNIPIDYIFLEVNEAFEKITGLISKDIVNKRATEIFPDINKEEFDWINFFGNVAVNQTDEIFEKYFFSLNKWYNGKVFSTEKNYFTVTFTETTNEHKISEYTKELNNFNIENIDYKKITDNAKELSGADYAVLNIFDENGKDFYTKAISGVGKAYEKIIKILGFSLENKKWEYDPVRERMIKDKKTTIFENLSDITHSVISKSVIKLLEKTFNLGNVVIVKTTKDNKMVGDLTLIFNKNNKLKNKMFVETYADLIGIIINRIQIEFEKSKQELKMKEQLIKFEELKKIAKFGYWERDLEKGEEYWDDNYYDIFEYEPQEFEPSYENFLNLVHEDYIEKVKKNSNLINNIHKSWKEIDLNNIKKEIQIKGITKKGKEKNLISYYNFLQDEKGLPIKLYGFMQDITNIKKAEERLNTLLTTLPDLLFIFDNKGNYKEIYAKDISLLASPEEKLKNSNIKDVLSKNDYESYVDAYNNLLKTKQPQKFDYELKINNKEEYYEAKLNLINENEHIILCRNITDKKEKEKDLRKQYKIFELISNISSNFVKINLNQIDDYLYNSLEIVMNFIKADKVSISEFTEDKKEYKIIYEKSLLNEEKNNRGFEIKNIWSIIEKLKKENHYFSDFENLPRVLCFPIFKNSEIKGFITYEFYSYILINNRDIYSLELISEVITNAYIKKVIQEELIIAKLEAEKANKSKSLFISKITHDLKTPLSAILGYSEMIKNDISNKNNEEYINLILHSSNNMLYLINDLLDISKIEANNLTLKKNIFNLSYIIKELISSISIIFKQKNNKIILIIDDKIPESLYGDSYRLNRIIQNLLSNSNKFTKGGEIKLEINLEKETEYNHEIKFVISDTGIGIKKEKLNKLFVPYYQAHDFDGKGTGLGLALCKELVDLMGGEIFIESEVDKGTTVTFTANFKNI